jgi:hypothetical protein
MNYGIISEVKLAAEIDDLVTASVMVTGEGFFRSKSFAA